MEHMQYMEDMKDTEGEKHVSETDQYRDRLFVRKFSDR